MDRLVLHELPHEERKAELSPIEIDRRINVDGVQYGDQLPLLLVQRAEEPLSCQHTRRAAAACKTARTHHQSDAGSPHAQACRAGLA